jgi:hypothetical protein
VRQYEAINGKWKYGGEERGEEVVVRGKCIEKILL